MKCIILAGGFGTRISEETHMLPKPMIEIGQKPIIWHIMKHYAYYGINEFIICSGYKAHIIKEFFANYLIHSRDFTVDLADNSLVFINSSSEDWKVSVVNTGLETMTGGRLKRIAGLIDDTCCMTYGDGLSNIDLGSLLAAHSKSNCAATMTVAQPDGRFGAVQMKDNLVTNFNEKPKGDGAWVNAGFFVLEPHVFDLIEGDDTIWERHPLETLAAQNQLNAFKHDGFWSAMDTLRDKERLESYWQEGKAPWKIWD